MKPLYFNTSKELTLGVELELQIVNRDNYDLATCAKVLFRKINASNYANNISPEITQSMIEINSSVHSSPQQLLQELTAIKKFLIQQADELNVYLAGGGTHAFQRWVERKIFPTKRFKHIYQQVGYLAKQYTVFGQHIHIGCNNGDDAIYLTHCLSRYVPHIIALNASSPFYQGIDTIFDSSRVNIICTLPLYGLMPFVNNWDEFSLYFEKMIKLGIVESMKDLHWDIRPKPEFGTVEIRVSDMPLSIDKAVTIAAFVQTLSHYILQAKPWKITPDFYLAYKYNRFQASRYGLAADFIDPITGKHIPLHEDILNTIHLLTEHSKELNNTKFIKEIEQNALTQQNDAAWLRSILQQTNSLKEVVQKQCDYFLHDTPRNKSKQTISQHPKREKINDGKAITSTSI